MEVVMLELLGLIAAGGAAAVGYTRSRDFVTRRLRFVDAVRSPAAPLVAGTAAAAVAMPLVWVLPIIGGGTALLFGVSVGFGTRAGVRRLRTMLSPEL
jgi:hypothetical protein